ncbi:glycosyltransferase [Microbacterium sp. P03]|uniref:glycosyltransferase n=1 Tax=Microbacterium sp. P03 TaxID=3366946 RepID=UPI0037472CC6
MNPFTRALKIAVIAPSRHALHEPHAGGLESAVWERVRGLREHGHEVVLCGPAGSDFLGDAPELTLPRLRWPDGAPVSDVAYPRGHRREVALAMHRAMAYIAHGPKRFDVVDNHSLHGVPIAWTDRLPMPMITTLHTPPLPEILAAHRSVEGAQHRYLAVSTHTMREWLHAGVESTVFPNAVDTRRWSAGTGGRGLVWFGRIVPEKAPHLAIDAARLVGRRLVLAGRVGDPLYFEREILPRLGPDVRYVGPLRQQALARVVGRSAVALVTPMWDEPFGLVIAEAMSTGTPVAAFDAGGVTEVTGGSEGALAVPRGDVEALAGAVELLIQRSVEDQGFRQRVRADAVVRHSLERRHDELEDILLALTSTLDERSAVA